MAGHCLPVFKILNCLIISVHLAIYFLNKIQAAPNLSLLQKESPWKLQASHDIFCQNTVRLITMCKWCDYNQMISARKGCFHDFPTSSIINFCVIRSFDTTPLPDNIGPAGKYIKYFCVIKSFSTIPSLLLTTDWLLYIGNHNHNHRWYKKLVMT